MCCPGRARYRVGIGLRIRAAIAAVFLTGRNQRGDTNWLRERHAQCHAEHAHAERSYDECHYAERPRVRCDYAERPRVRCDYAERPRVRCHYAEHSRVRGHYEEHPNR